MRVPMKKIIQESMTREMQDLGFQQIHRNESIWMRLLDDNKVVQLYRIRFIPLKCEIQMDFIVDPLIFFINFENGTDVDSYLHKKIGTPNSFSYSRYFRNTFYKMHDAQNLDEFNFFKTQYIITLVDAYTYNAKPHFLQASNFDRSLIEYEKIANILCGKWRNYENGGIDFNMYYVGNYFYKSIYYGNIDNYIDYANKYISEFCKFYGYKPNDYDEDIKCYKEQNVEYFMNQYKKVQERNAEEAAKLLGIDKEAFPYVPPLKELKL